MCKEKATEQRERKHTYMKEYRIINKHKLNKQSLAYNANNIEKLKEYRVANKDEYLKRQQKYAHTHKKHISARMVDYRRKLKLDILSYYSSGIIKCDLCPETRFGALTIDHIDGDGSNHRKSFKGAGSGTNFYLWLKNNKYPTGYRVLCCNCNILANETLRTNLLSQTKKAKSHRHKIIEDKQKFMDALGGMCVICKTSNMAILTCHHINNNGAEHRRMICSRKDGRGLSGIHFYRAVLKINDFTNLECRCFNCNVEEEWG